MARILVSETSPKLILNNHCAICEFPAAMQHPGGSGGQPKPHSVVIGEKKSKGTEGKAFHANQLAHTFRPRRNPKQPLG